MYEADKIPIKNIYYMVLYAWDKVKDISNISDKEIENLKDVNDVIIQLFLHGVQNILKRGIYKDYVNSEEESKFIKGKINIAETIKMVQPQMICNFDDYSQDIIYNKILKTVLIRISNLQGISKEDKNKTRALLPYFSKVSMIEINNLNTNTLIFNRFNKEYEGIIDLGILIYKNSIPTEERGRYKFIDILDNEDQMGYIFEEFLRKFYEIHSDYSVSRRYYNFDWKALESSNLSILPRMETDIELTSPGRKIIIDAKYYKNAFSSRYEGRKLISDHIYQMESYLIQNLNQYEHLEGILLYPSNGYSIDEKFISKLGYVMGFRTVDLNMDWEDIKFRLLKLLAG